MSVEFQRTTWRYIAEDRTLLSSDVLLIPTLLLLLFLLLLLLLPRWIRPFGLIPSKLISNYKQENTNTQEK
jgi:hypothetical protein